MKRLLLGFVLMTGAVAHGQQDVLFTQYMFNNLYFNPAYAGVEGVTKASLAYRNMWSGYQPTFYGGGAPISQMVSFSTPIYKLNSGFGSYVFNESIGPQNNLEAQVSYAYHLGLRDAKLSLGIRGGVYAQTINSDLYQAIDNPDPSLPPSNTGRHTQVKPDLAAGIFFRKENFYIGAGFSHLINAKFQFGLTSRRALDTHTFITGSYFYDLNFDVRFQGSTQIRTDFVKTQFDISGILYLKDTMWGGLSFRQSEAVIALLGWSFMKDKSLKAGYAMDIIYKDREAKQPLSHELMVTYELPVVPGVGKKVIRTPRYRH